MPGLRARPAQLVTQLRRGQSSQKRTSTEPTSPPLRRPRALRPGLSWAHTRQAPCSPGGEAAGKPCRLRRGDLHQGTLRRPPGQPRTTEGRVRSTPTSVVAGAGARAGSPPAPPGPRLAPCAGRQGRFPPVSAAQLSPRRRPTSTRGHVAQVSPEEVALSDYSKTLGVGICTIIISFYLHIEISKT